MSQIDVIHLEETLWLACAPTGVPAYDFAFGDFFPCRRPWQRPERLTAVARMGAAEDYARRFDDLRSQGITLVHTPEQYRRTSELPCWYPLIEELTPRSVWFDGPPSVRDVESHFTWPVFMKGERQTSKHQRRLSILEGPDDFRRAVELYAVDPILRWQRVVCREYVPLRLVGPESPHVVPAAFEFRTFWWRGRCAGIGPYWTGTAYDLTADERQAMVAVAAEAARRVDVPFLVVDIAQARDGRWIVIECNDGQDSGYAGVPPMLLWRQVLNAEAELEGGGTP